MLGNVAGRVLGDQHRADQCHPAHPRAVLGRQSACQVAAVGLAGHCVRPWGQLLDRRTDDRVHVVGRADVLGSHGATHTRQVEIDPAPAVTAAKNRLEAPGHQPVVRGEPVQQHQGPPRVGTPVLDVVDLHPGGVYVRPGGRG